MLKINVKIGNELFDEKSQSFVQKTISIYLEHSLLSISNWESKYESPFLDSDDHTSEQIYDYIKMMCLNKENIKYIDSLSKENMEEINDYISGKHTATTIYSPKNGEPSTRIITSELIYYWMFVRRIPIEAETWNLNRLITLIRVYDIEQSNMNHTNKMSDSDYISWQRAQNKIRREKFKTKG